MHDPSGSPRTSADAFFGRPRPRPARIAIVIPSDRGDWERERMAGLAESIVRGARAAGRAVEVVIATVGPPVDPAWADRDSVGVRDYSWRVLDEGESRRALAYAGRSGRTGGTHIVPDDGIRQFLDCDLWVVSSPRLTAPLLPIRPAVFVLDDSLHHAVGGVAAGELRMLADVLHAGSGAIVTSDWMREEAIHFFGLEPLAVSVVPRPLVQDAWVPSPHPAVRDGGRFTWFVDGDGFGGLETACRCLEHYVMRLHGRLVCRIVPLGSRAADGSPRLPAPITAMLDRHEWLRERVSIAEAADTFERIDAEIAGSGFVWHPAPADDGRLVAARALFGKVRCLAADTPAMRELDTCLGLGLDWMEGAEPAAMAASLARLLDRGTTARPVDAATRGHPASAVDDQAAFAAVAVHL